MSNGVRNKRTQWKIEIKDFMEFVYKKSSQI